MRTSRNDLEYKGYVLSDVKVIELLIAYRYKYDSYLFIESGKSSMSVDGALPFNEEMLLTYVSLDQCIGRCKFDQTQLNIIKMVGEGYTQEEIAIFNGLRLSTIKGRLKTIYRIIVKENERMWRKSIYLNELGLKSKKCSRCKEELPATSEFYSDSDYTKDGFYGVCKKCRN